MTPKDSGNRFFKPSRDSAPPPVEVAIDRRGDSAAGVRHALELHALYNGLDESMQKVVASGTDEDPTPAPSFRPAKSADELHAQGAKLIAAFRAQEGRDPTPRDEEFWATYAHLTEAYVDSLAKSSGMRKAKRKDPLDALQGAVFEIGVDDLGPATKQTGVGS